MKFLVYVQYKNRIDERHTCETLEQANAVIHDLLIVSEHEKKLGYDSILVSKDFRICVQRIE